MNNNIDFNNFGLGAFVNNDGNNNNSSIDNSSNSELGAFTSNTNSNFSNLSTNNNNGLDAFANNSNNSFVNPSDINTSNTETNTFTDNNDIQGFVNPSDINTSNNVLDAFANSTSNDNNGFINPSDINTNNELDAFANSTDNNSNSFVNPSDINTNDGLDAFTDNDIPFDSINNTDSSNINSSEFNNTLDSVNRNHPKASNNKKKTLYKNKYGIEMPVKYLTDYPCTIPASIEIEEENIEEHIKNLLFSKGIKEAHSNEYCVEPIYTKGKAVIDGKEIDVVSGLFEFKLKADKSYNQSKNRKLKGTKSKG